MELESLVNAQSLVFQKDSSIKRVMGNGAIALREEECCFWQNMDYKDSETAGRLLQDYELDPTVVEALCDEDTRPRFFVQGNGMAMILRAVNLTSGTEDDDMISLRIWVDEDKIITLEHHNLKAIEDAMHHIEIMKGIKTPTQCFLKIATKLADDIAEVSLDINDRTDDLESEVIDLDNLSDFELRGKLSSLRREIIDIRRYLAPQKDVFQNLQNEKIPFINNKNKAIVREISNSIIKAIEDLDYAKDHIAVYHEELQSKVSVNLSRTMYMMSIVTVIFLPLTLITGLLGINVSGIPFAESEYAFAAVCGIMVVICIILIMIMRKLRWL